MADRVAQPWPVEPIPDEDRLVMRVHAQWYDGETGDLMPGCFKNLPDEERDGMSTESGRYAAPHETRGRAGRLENYGVIALPVGGVRLIPEQRVEHDPLPDVRAHALVWGPKGRKHPRIRLEFLRIALPMIALGDPMPHMELG